MWKSSLTFTSELHTSSREGQQLPCHCHVRGFAKASLRPQVLAEENRCDYIQLKMRSFKQNGNGWREVFERHNKKFEESWLKPLSPHTQSELPHPFHFHAHTKNPTGIMHSQEHKRQGKWNNPLHILLFPATCYSHCFTQGVQCYCWATQSTQGNSQCCRHQLVLASSGNLRTSLEVGDPGVDRAAENSRLCPTINLSGQAKNCLSKDLKTTWFCNGNESPMSPCTFKKLVM